MLSRGRLQRSDKNSKKFQKVLDFIRILVYNSLGTTSNTNMTKKMKNHPIMKNTEARMAEWDKANPNPELGERTGMWHVIYREEAKKFCDAVARGEA